MPGYDNFSMSNNAVAAYQSGLVPASKIKDVPASLIPEYVAPAEWHHSSKMYNRVNFYDPAEVAAVFGLAESDDFEADPAAVAALAAHKAARSAAPVIYENCTVTWLEWGGTKKRPIPTERSADGCTVSVKGATATITLPDGTRFTKRLTTNGFSFRSANN